MTNIKGLPTSNPHILLVFWASNIRISTLVIADTGNYVGSKLKEFKLPQ